MRWGAEAGPADTGGRREGSAEMGPRRILVIDDNVHAADTMAIVVRHWGYDPRVAYDGPEGLAVASSFRPEAVILDIEMPTMSGLEVASRLRAQPAHDGIFLIALSGHDFP